jgi:hypothetical protein
MATLVVPKDLVDLPMLCKSKGVVCRAVGDQKLIKRCRVILLEMRVVVPSNQPKLSVRRISYRFAGIKHPGDE